jgi:hypothetical protein
MTQGWSHSIKYKSKSTFFNERQNFTELRLICAEAREWGKQTSQPLVLIPIRPKQPGKTE